MTLWQSFGKRHIRTAIRIIRNPVYILVLLAAGSFLIGIHQVHGSPTAYATPQPAWCLTPNSTCENRQPWDGVASFTTTSNSAFTNGIRISISFSIPNVNIIQSNNELGACISSYAPTNYPEDTFTVGRDYVYYGCVDVDGDGMISFVSSAWISCEWTACNTNSWSGCGALACTTPIQQSSRSDCQTSGAWNTCPDAQHWQLWHNRFFCSGCRVTDNYVIEMTWVPVIPQGPYSWWNYYDNGIVANQIGYTQVQSWEAGTGFKYEYGNVGCTQCQWSHYQFGVTSLYDIGSSGWHVDMTNPLYRGSDEYTWYPLPTVSYAGGQWAFTDQKYENGGMPYPKMTVTGSADTTNCIYKATFTDTGNTGDSAGDWTSLWNAAPGCKFSSLYPDFTITASPSALLMCPYNNAYGVGINLQSLSSFAGDVPLYVAYPSAFPSPSLGSTSIHLTSGGTGSTPLLINDGNAAIGTYTITVSGVSLGIFHSAGITATVTSSVCGGGGGSTGSIANGSLIDLANGTRIPVQDIRIGNEVIVYNVPTAYQTIAAVVAIKTVEANSTLTIHTSVGGTPFRADANPNMRLWVLTPIGPVLKPVTTIVSGDQIFNYDIRSWVRVTDVTITNGGTHAMYDIITSPKFTSSGGVLEVIANGYPDCGAAPCKT